MRPNPKFLELLRSLLVRSGDGRVPWQGTISPDAFRVIFDRATVRVGVSEDDDGRVEHYATLLDPKGLEMESITTSSLEHEADIEILRDLFSAARRTAMNVDDLLEDLIVDIHNDRPSFIDK